MSKKGGIRTLSDLNRGGGGDHGDRDSDDDDNGMNTYYAGGEKSGIQVQAPQTADNVAKRMAESAKSHGKQSADEAPPDNTFAGAGYRLGSDIAVPSAPVAAKQKTPQEEVVTITLTLYSDGFTVNEGPLRPLNDPRNEAFLNDVYSGIIPAELEAQYRTRENRAVVDLHFVDNRGQKYVPPKVSAKPFSGQGHTLGSSTMTTTTSTPAPSSTTSSAPKQWSLDTSKPVTSIQIRLHDGTRLVAKFNHDNTIADVYQFIEMSKPLGGRSFSLVLPPRQPIPSDHSKTLSEAGLLNAVVIQHLN